MEKQVAFGARKALIQLGKALPFMLCFVLFVEYAESLFSSVLMDFCTIGGIVIPNTPLSSHIACLFEYDTLSVFITLIISVAIEACKWNLYASLYLAINLIEKYIFNFEMELALVYIVIIINLMTSLLFTLKGLKIYIKSLKKLNRL